MIILRNEEVKELIWFIRRLKIRMSAKIKRIESQMMRKEYNPDDRPGDLADIAELTAKVVQYEGYLARLHYHTK